LNTNMNRIVVLLGLVALLMVSFNIAVPAAHAGRGGNQIRIDSTELDCKSVSEGCKWNVAVSAWLKDPSITVVKFELTVTFSDHRLNPNKQGDQVEIKVQPENVQNLLAQSTFHIHYMGPGYYLYVLNAYNAADNTLLGSDWADPQGTAG
jgi:hypothetical protein